MIRLKVKDIADARGISQGRLGRMANVDTKTMQKIYRHPTTAVITTPILDRIAMALEVDVSELLESIRDEPPETH
jgi:DNA-binding Xre family transcriptional regulator